MKTIRPTATEVLAARQQSGLTQSQAADKIHTVCRVWQQYESGDRAMHAAFFELFLIKTHQLIVH